MLNLVLHFLALKHKAELLERAIVRLREEEIHGGNLDKNPDAVDNVVLPANGVERDGVDICVKEDSEADCELLKRDALGPLLKGEYLDQVGVRKGVPANVVESVLTKMSVPESPMSIQSQRTYGE